MDDLIKTLESFNRKERYFLIRQALGVEKFDLCEEFREELSNTVGTEVPKEKDKVLVAMDYHLNWIHSSLVLAHYSDTNKRMELINDRMISDNQEDVDLLVAFKDVRDHYHLIFVEAKGYDAKGFASFDMSQLRNKIGRLESILNSNRMQYDDVEPYFCLMSGFKPLNLKSKEWSTWNGKPLKWLQMSLPDVRLVANYYPPSITKIKKTGNLKRFNIKKIAPAK